MRSGRSRPANCSFGRDEVTFVILAIGWRLRFFVGAEEVGQLGPLGFAASVRVRCGIAVNAGQPKRLGQPTAIGQETLGLLGHVALFQMTDQLGCPFAGAFADGFEDARLGDTVEVVAEGRAPAGFDVFGVSAFGTDLGLRIMEGLGLVAVT